MQKLPITVIILTKNEQEMISNCIETVPWAQEVIVIDTQSTDQTVQLAKRAGAIVYTTDKESFADRRNYGLTKVRTPWLMYLDADERTSPELVHEIEKTIQQDNISAITLTRQNVHYGKIMEHGGWEHDTVTRIFKTQDFKGWTGKIHESAEFSGEVAILKEPLIHLTHRNMVDGLYKTIAWTGVEAELLYEAKHPPVKVSTLLRKSFMEFYRRAFVYKGRKDGIQGWIEALTQGMNKFIVYERLWELQQKPSLEQRYEGLDQELVHRWKSLE